jgi:glutamate/tyrosine decarboxylase-like PLP-dependent enzyme
MAVISDAEFLRVLESLVRDVLADEEETPVRVNLDPATCIDELDLNLPEHGIGFEKLAAKLRRVLAHSPTTSTAQFFNQLFGGRDWASVLGDMLVPVVNNSMYTYKVAGPHVLIERVLVEKMGALMGFKEPGGIFSPGGSLSNLTAIVLARNEAEKHVRENGLSAKKHRIYTSSVSHYSIRKGANMAGVGRDNVVKIPVDEHARMRPDALDAAIEKDREDGCIPTLVNATLGTTVEGAFDPIPAIAQVCQKHGVWLHLDGAWGGSMVLSPEKKHLFEGAHLADSISWDAHKMMGVPLTSSVLLTKEQDVLTRHLSENADYLFQQDTDWLNPGTRSIQCGRRNDFLKVWTGWQVHGDAGYAERIRRCLELVQYAVGVIRDDPRLELALEPESLNVCFTVKGACSKEICASLYDQARVMVGFGEVADKTVVRVIFLNPALTTSDLDYFFQNVLEVAA